MSMSTASGGSSTYLTLQRIRHDVFISFRGADTRCNFTSHLRAALQRAQIKTFIDEDDLRKGHEIHPTLLKAIEESKLCLIIFSKDYAASTWCLEELVHILRCKGREKVLPVFYNVDPSDDWKKQESYAMAFAKLEERFKDEMDRVRSWREALTRMANQHGWSSSQIRCESKLVEVIVEEIKKKLLYRWPNHDLKGLVGVRKHIWRIGSLCIGSSGVRMLGIWGMGGIGKTTLARAVFDSFSFEFEACTFVENVREESEKHRLIHLKKELFDNLLEDKDLEIGNHFVINRLRRKKVLVVFDDVNDPEQLENLGGDCFGLESKIIITSRDKQVLRNIGVDETYEVEGLDDVQALQLFSLHAFKRNLLTIKEKELSKRVINISGGNPLALKVLGRHLYSKGIREWESTLDKLQKYPDKKIQNVLRISYDSLHETEKDIFLDIACFFKGEDRDFVEHLLDVCGLFATAGIGVLVDKALITVGEYSNAIQMHDLLQMMAFELVRPQSTDQDPKKGRRLWLAEDVYHAFKYNRGIAAIEGISLDTSKFNEEIILRPKTFSKMHRLRLLIINGSNISLPQGPLPFPHSLVYLKWDAYPLKSLSTNFASKNLVALDMRCSKLKQLWNGIVRLENLKSIKLTGSMHLTQVPDLSRAPNIESIDLNFCEHLLEIPSSFQYLTKLNKLELVGCSSLCKFSGLPKHLGTLRVFTPLFEREQTWLFDCKNCGDHHSDSTSSINQYRNFPCHIDNRKRPSFMIGSVDTCEISHFKICSKLERFPEILEPIESLKFLHLEFTAITELPLSIKNLTGLQHLCLDFCLNLEFLPDSIHALRFLKKLEIRHCPKLKSLPTLPLSLFVLDARYCAALKKVSSSRTTVKQNWDNLYRCDSYGELFEFYGCQMLDENARKILADEAQFRMLRYAVLCTEEEYFSSFLSQSLKCWLRWPGRETPTWFSHKSEGSSISIDLPHPASQWYKNSYLGLAFFVVLYFDEFPDDPYCDRSWKICCNSLYTFPNGESLPRTKYLECSPFFKYSASCFNGCCAQVDSSCEDGCIVDATNSDHVCVFFDDYNEHLNKRIEYTSSSNSMASFSFWASREGIRVKRCGVHPLYTQEAERFGFVTPANWNWNIKWRRRKRIAPFYGNSS